MDLRLLASAVWRHWLLVAAGIAIGLALGTAALYEIGLTVGQNGVPRLWFTERSYSTFETEVQLLVLDPAFGIGRAGQDRERPDSFRRTIEYAPTYARLVLSEPVLEALEEDVGPIDVSITSQNIEQSPIVRARVVGSDRERVLEVASGIEKAFRSYLVSSQDEYQIPEYDRMAVEQLAQPSAPQEKVSRDTEVAAIAFLAPVLFALGLAFALENVRQSRGREAGAYPDVPPSGAVAEDHQAAQGGGNPRS